MAKGTESVFGPNNLKVTETAEKVTVEFDPRVLIGTFKTGNPKVASTNSYRPLDLSGCRLMLHVIGKKAA